MTSTSARPTTDELAARATALRPTIESFSDTIEEQRQLPPELVREFREAGFFRLLVPSSAEPNGADPITAGRVVEEVALADGSAGWAVMIAAQNAVLGGYLPPDEVRTIWGDDGICCGTARPIGKAVAVDAPESGFMVSGRWPFASGSSHATWFAGECEVYDGDEPRRDAEGNVVTRVIFVPRDEVTVHDTWFTTGLRGTASNDFSIDGSFVPLARGFQMLVSPPQHDDAIYRALPLVFLNHATHAVGVARGAREAALEIIKTKRGWGGVPLGDAPRMQTAAAEATVTLEAARAYLYQVAEELWTAALAGDAPQLLRSRCRLGMSNAVTASVTATDLLHSIVGTTGIMQSSPLERRFRDLHTAATHVMIGPLTYEAAGRVELGRGPDFPFF